MRKLIWILFSAILLSACGGPPAADLPPEPVSPSSTPIPTQTATPTSKVGQPLTAVPQPTSQPDASDADLGSALPDLSSVTLFQATHLMDPSNFQVTLDHWPEGFLEEATVTVEGEAYSCDELFPDEYPNRVYCWGTAPAAGIETSVVVTIAGKPEPLLEIPFVVPKPGGG